MPTLAVGMSRRLAACQHAHGERGHGTQFATLTLELGRRPLGRQPRLSPQRCVMLNLSGRILWESWLVLCELAPYLLFGFLMAGALSIFISPQWVERRLGRGGFAPVWKAALFGVPLPLCSCGVIPVAASMRRHGASRAAVAAFLLSTPQTGMDSIAATYALLGPIVAVFRPIAALATGLLGGALVLLLGESNGRQAGEDALPPARKSAAAAIAPNRRPYAQSRYGLVTLPRDVAFSLLVGIVLAGALSALAPANQLHAYLGGGVVSILILMAAGVPVYVCATASVPIAAGIHRHGGLARRRPGLPHFRPGDQSRHLHHRLEALGNAEHPALFGRRGDQRRRLRPGTGQNRLADDNGAARNRRSRPRNGPRRLAVDRLGRSPCWRSWAGLVFPDGEKTAQA